MKYRERVSAQVRKYAGVAGWHFITVPDTVSTRIRKWIVPKKVGFGYIPVTARVGETSWKTTLFPSKDAGPYLLALKASVRKREEIYEGDTIRIEITHP
jgi:Domain of unknown function (DUF1905)